ncbi:hypothetical protein VTL71DRAFT_5673 [Oculimacula yallundae]|uniref:Uncharacterized protein n=1 Tax=Oculimacula yallundae TaxID=86028 RepID=A0ABR4BZD1_9HELO
MSTPSSNATCTLPPYYWTRPTYHISDEVFIMLIVFGTAAIIGCWAWGFSVGVAKCNQFRDDWIRSRIAVRPLSNRDIPEPSGGNAMTVIFVRRNKKTRGEEGAS